MIRPQSYMYSWALEPIISIFISCGSGIRFGHPIIFFLPTNSLFYFEAHSIFPLSYLDNWLFLALPCSLNLGLPLLSQATFSGLPIGILHLGSFQVSNIWWVQYNKIRLSTLNFRDIKMYSLQCPNVQFY